MSATEQIALVNKFGTHLQSAVATRFDRVERTLSQMERFLDFQKPLYRLDAFVTLGRCGLLKPWPKLIQNLRSTRQTELCDAGIPPHVVSAWMGNSAAIANRHYLQVTDNHFDLALREPNKVQPVATLVATHQPKRRRMGPLLRRTVNEKSREIRGHSSGYVVVPLRQMGAEGLEPPTPSV